MHCVQGASATQRMPPSSLESDHADAFFLEHLECRHRSDGDPGSDSVFGIPLGGSKTVGQWSLWRAVETSFCLAGRGILGLPCT